jgi:uncharacterized integral membrane protein (TIGR00698 family)
MALKNKFYGILLATSIGVFSLVLSSYFSFFNAILLGLLLGIGISNLIKIPNEYHSGITFTSTKMLEFSVIFLAFGINYTNIVKLGASSFVLISIVIIAILLITIYLSKKMNCPSVTGLFVGFGTAICGSSAIAALAPSYPNQKEDIGISLAVVNLYGVIGMILLPIILPILKLSSFDSSLIIGGSLHSVGNVAGAGFSMSQQIGDNAITIKLARVALLSPALLLFNFLTSHDPDKNWRQHLQLPWYLWLFIFITIFVSFFSLNEKVLDLMNTMGKIVLTIAMAAIGLKVSFYSLIKSGRKGLLFGFITFAIQIILILIGLQFI